MVRSVEVGAELLTRQADGTWPDDFTKAGEQVDLASVNGVFDFNATMEFGSP